MNVLLDTHMLLWAALEPERIPTNTKALIEDGANQVLVSTVSAWEVAIKQSLGKLELARPAERWLPDVIRATGFEVLQVTMESALRVRGLPWHHRDPFDRLLIAQALQDRLTLASCDAAFQDYAVDLLNT